MEYDRNDTLEIDLHGLSPDGRTVGRTSEGMTVFVRGGLPGERVLVRLNHVKKRMAEAELVRVLKPSSDERPAPCVHAEDCGGCPWQRLPGDRQLAWKERIVQDALRRLGRLELPEGVIRPALGVGDKAEWGYRNKMEFAFAQDENGSTRLGLRARSSRAVTEVTQCLLQTPRTMAVLEEMRGLCRRFGLRAAPSGRNTRERTPKKKTFSSSVRPSDILRFVVIREPRAGGCLVELITLPSPQETANVRKLGEALMDAGLGVTGFVHSIRTDEADVAYGENTAFSLGEAGLSETLHLQGRDVTFTLDHNSFFQVNSAAAELLYNTAAELASPLFSGEDDLWGQECWDIYCGAGGLALTMSPHFSRVFGMESVAQAVELASANAKKLKESTKFHFVCGDAARLESIFRERGVPDLVVTDPPRAGMDERTVQALLKHRPPRLVLVSCNPATLARDLALLSQAYDIRAVQPVDLFPQTPHIETIAALSLAAQNTEKPRKA